MIPLSVNSDGIDGSSTTLLCVRLLLFTYVNEAISYVT